MNINFGLSKKDTSILKGIAILGMLFWHLYFCENPLGTTFHPWLKFFSEIGDSCVSIFLFTSGYGLSVSYERVISKNLIGGGKFVMNRLLKFYSNFWFIFLVFVPIGVFIFDIPLEIGNGLLHKAKDLIYHVFALSEFRSYNGAWWFNKLIIRFYILFPFIYLLIRKAPKTTLVVTPFVIAVLYYSLSMIWPIYSYIFMVGIAWAMYRVTLTERLSKAPYNLMTAIIAITFILLTLWLYFLGEDNIYLRGLPCFGMFTIVFAFFVIYVLRRTKVLQYVLDYLGKHSSNIYMTHLFLIIYWFPEFFFSIGNPILLMLIFLACNILLSEIIERVKTLIHWNKPFAIICNKINKFEYKSKS